MIPLTPGDRHPAHIPMAEMLAEARRELDQRRRVYPDMQTKGRMTAHEVDHQMCVIAAIIDDLVRAGPEGHGNWNAHPDGFTSQQKISALRRELAMRARFYPDWITKGRLRAPDAKQQREAMTGVLWIYAVRLAFHSFPDGVVPGTPNGHAAMRAQMALLDIELPDWRLPPEIVPIPEKAEELAL